MADCESMRFPRLVARDQSGFTMVELMVAAGILLVGLLGVLTMTTKQMRTSALNNQRVAATNFARELTEALRSIDYVKLDPTQLRTALQARGNLGSGTPWTVTRRGVTYTLTTTVCTYDDPADKIAAVAPANKCTDNATGTTGDQNGDDFRRVTMTMTWKDRGRTRSMKQSAVIMNPTGGIGPSIKTIAGPAAEITSGTTATINLTTSLATAVRWNADDGQSTGVATGGIFNWTITWDLKTAGTSSSVFDGTYSVIAQAFDDRDVPGDSKIAQVVINRVPPFAPSNFAGGQNTRNGGKGHVDFDWASNPERDIVGYRLYWAGDDKVKGGTGTAADVQTCPTTPGDYLPNTDTSCADFVVPSGGAVYYLTALDKTSAGAIREGGVSYLSIAGANARPDPPAGPLTVIPGLDGMPMLKWFPPASGTTPYFYRIYRDGSEFNATTNHRYSRVPGTQTTFTDDMAGTGAHTYYVTAVDAKYNESTLLGPISWAGAVTP